MAVATLRPPEAAGMGRGIALALLAHGLLVLALTYGLHWRSDNSAAFEAELWSAVPQVAAPREEAPPEPEPEAPRPDPRAAQQRAEQEAAEQQQRDAEIALAKEKKRKEEKAREEAARLEREKAAKEKEAKDKALKEKAEKEKAEKDKAKEEQERKKALDAKAAKEAKEAKDAEARREAFEALAPQKSARQGLVTLGALWDRMRRLAGAGRSCSAQAAGEVLAEGRRLLHSHLRRVRAVHSLQKSGFSCSGGASMSMSINGQVVILLGCAWEGEETPTGNPQGNCAPRKRRRRGHTGNGVAGDGR